MTLTPEDRQKLRTKQVANVIRKLNAGNTLTAREEALLAQQAAPDEVQTSGNLPPTGGYAKTWEELAEACSVDRRTLSNVRERHAANPRLPKDRADGRKEIAPWIEFLREIGCEGRGINHPQSDYIDERALRLRERQLAVEAAEHKLKVQKRDVLPLVEYQAALRVTVGAFDAALKQIPGRAADQLIQRVRLAFLAMLRKELTEKQFTKLKMLLESAEIDHAGVIEILDTELEAARLALAEADFLEPDPDLE